MIDYIINKINRIENRFLKIYVSGLFTMLLFALATIIPLFALFNFTILLNFVIKSNDIILKFLFFISILSIIFFLIGFVVEGEKEYQRKNKEIKKD